MCSVVIGIIGTYFFEEAGVTETVNSDRCCNMLENFLAKNRRIKYGAWESFWLQLDGATAHTTRRSRSIRQEIVQGQVVSLYAPIQWPTCSPDLSPCGFFYKVTSRPRFLNTSKDPRNPEDCNCGRSRLDNPLPHSRKSYETFMKGQGHH